MKKLFKILGITIGVAVILVACILGAITLYEKQVINLSASTSTRTADNNPIVTNLIGTGYDLNGGVASTTAVSTVFQFATSTDETYWGSLMNSTSTNYFTVNSDQLTFEIYFDQANGASSAVMDFYASNDAGCSIADYSGVEWYALSGYIATPTTTPSDITTSDTATSITLSGDETFSAFTVNTPNISCMKVVAYNASTTDGSLLHVKTIK